MKPDDNWSRAARRTTASRLRVVKPFDPYHCPLCTCPPKLTLNVYTGCGTDCFYCYTSSYAWGRWGRQSLRWGARKSLHTGLEKDIATLAQAGPPLSQMPIVLSLSSDPYPDAPRVNEAQLGHTRHCLKMLSDAGMQIMIQTKSDMLLRDMDILDPRSTVIGMTITTPHEELAAQMEPHAPPPKRRMAALARAAAHGFATVCRVDPLVPGVNDDAESIALLAALLRDAGVKRIISSTFKKRWDSARRFAQAFPEQAAASEQHYERQPIQGYRYLRAEMRRLMMEGVLRIAHDCGLAFSCCREGFAELNDGCCDGRIPQSVRS